MQTVLLHSTSDGRTAAGAVSAVVALAAQISYRSRPTLICEGRDRGGGGDLDGGDEGSPGSGTSSSSSDGGSSDGRTQSRCLCLMAEVDLMTGNTQNPIP